MASTTLLFLLSTFAPILSCRSEFTVVLPDSSALVDNPQTGFSARARTDPAEQRAVYEIMAATGNGWAASIPDVCRGRWHGIECLPDADDVLHVIALSFGALSDDTAFPPCDSTRSRLSPALLALPHLRSLLFYRCFAGNPQPIPAFLGRLGPALRSLVLRENGLVGPIPAELGKLTSLRVLDLHGNRLGSSIPPSLQRLKRLQLLDLSHNRLNGVVPAIKFPALKVLDLSRNSLQGRIPALLGQCDSLVKMDLSRNRFMGSIPDSLSNLKGLILLDLSHNRLSGPLPSSLGGLTSLTAMILSKNPMGATMIPADGFVGLKELVTLILSDMDLQGPIPDSLGELASLRVLHLDGNELNGSIPQSFQKLEKLSELRLNNNRLTGPLPFGKEMVWRMGKKLRLYNNFGLCYDAGNGRYEGIDSLSEIRYCETESKRAEGSASAANMSSHITKHFSSMTGHDPPSDLRSAATIRNCGLLRMLALITGCLLSVLPFL